MRSGQNTQETFEIAQCSLHRCGYALRTRLWAFVFKHYTHNNAYKKTFVVFGRLLLLKTKARHFRPDAVRQTQDARIWTVHDTADASMNTSVLVDAPVLAKRKPIFVLMLLGALLLTLLTVMLLLSLFQLPPRIPRFVRIRCVPLYGDAGSHLAPHASHYTHAYLAILLPTADITHCATDAQATVLPMRANAR